MKNRVVGIIIIGIAVLIGFIVFSFNSAMTEIVSSACTHGPECVMWDTLEFQTNVSIGIMVFVVIIGLYLIFFGEEEKIITKIKKVKEQIKPEEITKGNYQKILDSLGSDERLVLERVIESKGNLFQSELVEKTNFTKVKITRILDKLEGRGLIERKRRGMTNVIILKH